VSEIPLAGDGPHRRLELPASGGRCDVLQALDPMLGEGAGEPPGGLGLEDAVPGGGARDQ
jgi:hypothetical protein